VGVAEYQGAHNHSLRTIRYDASTYDLRTELIWLDQSGGVVGNASTGKAEHGGVYIAEQAVSLTKGLLLVEYTTLRVKGDLRTNGHAVNISAFATLEVEGSLIGGTFKMGTFATIDVKGDASFHFSADAWYMTGGGGCEGSCDPAFFNRSYPGGFYKAFPAYLVIGGDLLLTEGTPSEYGGFHTTIIDVGHDLKVAGSFACGADASIRVGASIEVAADMRLNDRVSLQVGGDMTVRGTAAFSDSTGVGGAHIHGNMAVETLTIYHYGLHVGGDLYVGSGGALVNAASWTSEGKGVVVGGTASLVFLTLEWGFSTTFIAKGPFVSIGKLEFKGCSNCSFIAEQATVHVGTVDFGQASGHALTLKVASLEADTIFMGSDRYDPYAHRIEHVFVDASIAATRMRVGSLLMAKSNGVLVDVEESALIANLSLGSGTRLRVARGPINVTHELTLAPHFYTRCPAELDDVPAGSCEAASTCSTQTCGWTSPPVCPCDPPLLNISTRQSDCYLRKSLCAGDSSVPDLSCDWLLAYARTRCFVGPDGVNVFSMAYNASQPCPQAPVIRQGHV